MTGALIGLILGAIWGAIIAWRRNGNAMDIAQYAVGFGIALALLGLFVSVFIVRMT